jgi:hypothetical protein
MNRKSVSDVTPPLGPTPKTGDLPYVKVRSIGDKLIEKYSPIAKHELAAANKKTPPLARQKRNPWTTDVSQDSTLSSTFDIRGMQSSSFYLHI